MPLKHPHDPAHLLVNLVPFLRAGAVGIRLRLPLILCAPYGTMPADAVDCYRAIMEAATAAPNRLWYDDPLWSANLDKTVDRINRLLAVVPDPVNTQVLIRWPYSQSVPRADRAALYVRLDPATASMILDNRHAPPLEWWVERYRDVLQADVPFPTPHADLLGAVITLLATFDRTPATPEHEAEARGLLGA